MENKKAKLEPVMLSEIKKEKVEETAKPTPNSHLIPSSAPSLVPPGLSSIYALPPPAMMQSPVYSRFGPQFNPYFGPCSMPSTSNQTADGKPSTSQAPGNYYMYGPPNFYPSSQYFHFARGMSGPCTPSTFSTDQEIRETERYQAVNQLLGMLIKRENPNKGNFDHIIREVYHVMIFRINSRLTLVFWLDHIGYFCESSLIRLGCCISILSLIPVLNCVKIGKI